MTVHAGMTYISTFYTLQANFVKINLRHAFSLLLLDTCIGTFLFLKKALPVSYCREELAEPDLPGKRPLQQKLWSFHENCRNRCHGETTTPTAARIVLDTRHPFPTQ